MAYLERDVDFGWRMTPISKGIPVQWNSGASNLTTHKIILLMCFGQLIWPVQLDLIFAHNICKGKMFDILFATLI